jgi:hypothetical protein
MASTVTSMEPLSARIPSDLYAWLAQLAVDGATTNSDKLRVVLGHLKRQHDGAYDYVAAHAWARDLTARLRETLLRIEGDSGRHSEVMAVVIEHTTATLAQLMSSVPSNEGEAAALEDVIVRRSLTFLETLLRQATTSHAAAFDPTVVRRNLGSTIELFTTLQNVNPGDRHA